MKLEILLLLLLFFLPSPSIVNAHAIAECVSRVPQARVS